MKALLLVLLAGTAQALGIGSPSPNSGTITPSAVSASTVTTTGTGDRCLAAGTTFYVDCAAGLVKVGGARGLEVSSGTLTVNGTGAQITVPYVQASSVTTTGGININGGTIGLNSVPAAQQGITGSASNNTYTVPSAGTHVFNDRWGVAIAQFSAADATINGALVIPGNSFKVGTSTFVATGGKVGIGTASPAGRLQVFQSANTSPVIMASGGGEGRGNFESSDENRTTSTLWTFGRDNTSTGDFVLYNSATKILSATNAGIISIPNNLGIGTASPGTKLHVASGTILANGTGAAIRLDGPSYKVIEMTDSATDNGRIDVLDNGAAEARIGAGEDSFVGRNNGNFGVGTIAPATKLDVNGNAQFGSGATKSTFSATGALTFPGGASLAGASGSLLGLGTSSPLNSLHISRGSAGVALTSGQVSSGTVIIQELAAGRRAVLTLASNDNVGGGASNYIDFWGNSFGGGMGHSSRIQALNTQGTGTGKVSGNLIFATSNDAVSPSERMRLNSLGNLGLGTSSPNNRLTIANNNVNGVAFDMRSDDTTLANADFSVARLFADFDSTSYTDSKVQLQTATGENTWLTALTARNGRVGIGTTNPAQTLDVQGGVGFFPQTRAQLEARTPGRAGEAYYCSNCLNGVNMVISTGTTLSGFDSFGVGGTAWH